MPPLSTLADHASIAGLVVSVVGFIWAILQATAAATSARRAASAAEQATSAFQQASIIAELATVTATIDEIRRHVRASVWHQVLDRCATARQGLSALRSRRAELSPGQMTALTAASAQISTLERQVEQHIITPIPGFDVAEINSILGDVCDSLTETVAARISSR